MVENLEDRLVLATFVVDITVDEDDGNVGAGDVSLREAIHLANGTPGADTITFDAALANQTIILGGTQLQPTESVTIDGSALSGDLTINANRRSRIFYFNSADEQLTLLGLTLASGFAEFGGAIRVNMGELWLEDSTLSGNTAHRDGGGIDNRGTVIITDSTLTGNTADRDGGGIYNLGTVTIINSTLSGNSADFTGGGMENNGPATITNSTLSGNEAVRGGGINSSLNSGTATITDSTLSGNSATLGGGTFTRASITITNSMLVGNSARSGGGILNQGTATIAGSTISGNTASGTTFDDGGGIDNNGSVTITNSTVSGNSAGGDGGGIHGGTVTIANSSLSGNSAGDDGGGVWGGAMTITDSTLSGNFAGGDGGGVYIRTGMATFTNSTLSGNTAAIAGGGVYNVGTTTVNHSTLANNSAAYAGSGVYNLGGDNDSVGFTISNSIVADSQGAADIFNGATLGGAFNVIGDGSDLSSFTDSIQADPMLGPLSDNGGPTLTHLPATNSPAINAGDPAAMAGIGGTPESDQRGMGFARVQAGLIDIGAVETDGLLFEVSTTSDVVDADFSPGELSLREAVLLANQAVGADTITFDSTLSGNTITLSGTHVALTESVLIDASMLPAGITIDADHQSRSFYLDSAGSLFRLRRLTLTNGNASHGGAIHVEEGELWLRDSTLYGNSANDGGGVYNNDTATITDSTLSGNSANTGGGLDNRSAATISNSTLSGNSASDGGGIFNRDTVTIASSTLSGNSADDGGGIFNDLLGTATVANSIAANSHGATDMFNEGTLSGAFNLIGDGSYLGSFTDSIQGDPMLGPLADNGGPTPTHLPATSSLAINAGDLAAVSDDDTPHFDQRGSGFARIAGLRIDIGAVETATMLPAQGLEVSTTSDVVDGVFSPGELSLREAVLLANEIAGANAITFESTLSGNTITLSGTQLALTETVSLDASPLPAGITIDADSQSRIFYLDAAEDLFTLRGLTLTNGNAGLGGAIRVEEGELLLEAATLSGNSAGSGGGISNNDISTINDSTLSGNSAGSGGGVDNQGTATINDSTLSGNSAFFGGSINNGSSLRDTTASINIANSTLSGNSARFGGGISNFDESAVVITDSTLSGNSAEQGGGFHNRSTATIINSTVSGNSADRGGGFDVVNAYYGRAYTTIENSTLSENSTALAGGGIYARSGTVAINNSTLSGNSASTAGGGLSNRGRITINNSTLSGNSAGTAGGGVYNHSGSYATDAAIFNNSIVANSQGAADIFNSATLSGAFNLVGDGSYLSSFTNSIQGDPLLGALSDNGGPTLTHLPTADSPAIHAGDPTAMAGVGDTPEFDQRGAGFTRVKTGRIDIGAVETDGLLLQVSTTSDVVDGNLTPGELSLREAILLANQVAGADVISFDAALSNQTITLGGTELVLTDSVKIDASPLSGALTIDANGQSRVFDLDSAGSLFTLQGLTLVNGHADRGGAIRVGAGQLQLRDSTLTGNSASLSGGAVFNPSTATISNSTLSGNSAGYDGGGVDNSGMVTITNSTLFGNSASNNGGGLNNSGTATMSNSITSNSQGTADLYNNSVLGGAFNLIGDGSYLSNFTDSIQGDPMLGPLTNNGGPTPTHLPATDSPVVNSGDLAAMAGASGETPEFDQRGIGFGRVQAGRIDIGAVEIAAILPPQGLEVSTSSDIVDSNFSSGQLSLREAVLLANQVAGDDTITFASVLADQTITLAGTALEPTEPLTIDASALSGELTIDANRQSRIFYLDDAGVALTLRGLTLTGGDAYRGGAIFVNVGELQLEASTLSGNSADRDGGGIYNRDTVTISNSTITGNFAPFSGSGIDNDGTATISSSAISGNNGIGLSNGGTATINNSTVSGNSKSGIVNSGVVTIAHSTLHQNLAQNTGGIVNFGTATITNSIVANNQGISDIVNSYNASLNGAFNLIGDGGYLNSFTDSIQGDPLLGPLADNGGPTLTYLPAANSPVIDAGDPAAMAGIGATPEFDQRGVGFPRVANGRIDMGAIEVQPIVDPDFNDDGIINGIDIDMLQANIVIGPADPALYDLDGDGLVTIADRDEWLAQAGAANLPSGNAYLLGDANLDGVVDGPDFVAWNDNKFSTTSAWTLGDFNADGVVDGPDFVLWNDNKFQSADNDASTNRPSPWLHGSQIDSKRIAPTPLKHYVTDLWAAGLLDDEDEIARWHHDASVSDYRLSYRLGT